MSDVWELAAYMESHPDDHPQRWRLAKRLYAEHEYLLALEQLQVLSKEWTPKLSVQRYLAATYYRLGRYAEAEEHLSKTIEQWPDEVGPCEQLAHVYQVDGKPKESLAAWRRVLELSPEHTVAKRAVVTLEDAISSEEKEKKVPISGIFQPNLTADQEEELLVTGVICPQCGAQNSDEFETCWQCNTVLRKQSPSFLNAPPVEAHGTYLLRPETMTALALIVIGCLLIASVVVGARLFLAYKHAGESPLFSMAEIGNRILVPARLGTGIVMLVFWPLALKLALKLFRAKPSPPEILIFIPGLLVGSLVLLLILLPMPFPIFAFVGSLVISLCIVVFTFKTYLPLAPAVWITQFLLVWTLGAVTFWAVECRRYGEFINPLLEGPAIQAAVTGPLALPDAVPIKLQNATTTIEEKVRWKSSGSTWLDVQATTVAFTVHPESAAPDLRFQVYQDSDLRYHEDLQGKQERTILFPVTPGREYKIVIRAGQPIPVQATIQSLLPFEFLD